MKRLLSILLLAVAAAAAYLWANSGAFVELARTDLERELSAAFGAKTVIESLRLSLVPPLATAEGIAVGDEFARLDRLDVRLALLATLAEARPVAKMVAQSLYVDLTRRPESRGGAPIAVPPLRIGGVRIDDLRLRFRIGDEIAHLAVAQLRGQIDSSVLRRQLVADVGLKQCVLRRASQSLDLGNVRITGYRDAEGVTIESASLLGPGRKIEVSGSSATRHQVRGELDLHDLVIIDDDFDPFSGAGRVTGEIVGTLDAPTLSGRIEIDDGRIAGRRVGVLTTSVHHEGETTRFEDARLRGDAGEVHGNVTAKFRREVPVEGVLAWNVTDLDTLLNKVNVAWGFDDRLQATTRIIGHFDPIDLQVAAEGAVSAGGESAQIRATSRIGKREAHVEFALVQDVRSRIKGDLKVLAGSFDGRADVETTDLRALSALAPRPVHALDLSGGGSASLRIAGTSETPRLDGTLIAGPLSIGAVDLDAVEGAFEWTEQALVLSSATLRTRGGEAVVSGKIALEADVANAWRLGLTKVGTDLATRIARRFGGFPEVVQGGTLTGTVECSGLWSNPELRASVLAEAPQVAGEDFVRLEVNGERLASRWNVDLEAIHPSDLRLRVRGGASPGAPARLSVAAPPFDLGQVALARRFGISGTIALEGELTGDLTLPGGDMRLVAADLAIGDELVGQVELHAVGTGGNWRLQGEAPAKRLSIVANAVAKSPFPYTARIDWEALAFDYKATESDHLAGAATGALSLEGELAAVENSRASVQVTDLQLQWGDAFIGLELPIVGSGRITGMQFQPFTLVGKETNLTIAGAVTSAADVELTLNGTLSLDYLELLGEPFVSTDGKVVLDVKLRRSAANPWHADGTAMLERSVLDFGLPAALSNAAGRIALRGRVAEVETFTATSGGGDVSAEGRIDVDQGPRLKWRVADVALNLDEDLEGVVSGAGTLDGSWRNLSLKGDVEIKSALYTRDFEVVDIPALFRPEAQAVVDGKPATQLHLDLQVAGRDGLYIDNNVAQVEVALDGRVRGTPQEPQLMGTLGVVGGEVKVRRRTFRLTAGAADFRGDFPPNPNVNINAETEITTREADYLITATVTGTARDPVVHFTADDPSLTQNDLVTLVAVGRTAAELQGETGGVTSIDALALLPTSPVEEQVTQFVGIDRFEIDLAQTNSQGDVTPGVTIGKNLTDRLRAALTTAFDTDARNVVSLEYDVTRRLSLLGQWEAETESEAGAFGAGLRLRYEFRRIPFSILGRRTAPRVPDAN
jgi:hypothetical protein